MFRSLVHHLQNKVDHPPVYAFTSHQNLVLTDMDDYERWLVRIIVETWPEGLSNMDRYEIHYPLAPPWEYGCGFAKTVEEATTLILDALNRA